MFDETPELYDILYAAAGKDYAAEADYVRGVIAEKMPGARTLLDVACGTGGHLVYLREHLDVEGLDLNADLLEIARAKLPGVPFHHGDMIDLDLGRTFDVITCLFSSIGAVVTVENLHRTIAAWARHLNRDGVIVIEPWIPVDWFRPGRISLTQAQTEEVTVVRMASMELEDRTWKATFEYLIGTKDGIERRTEQEKLTSFTREQFAEGFARAGLQHEFREKGFSERGLYVAWF